MTEIIYKKASYAIIGTCLEVCFGKIVLELKTVSALADEHRAQVLNYLPATGFDLGRLANFGHYPQLEYQRIAKTRSTNTRSDFPDVSL